MCEGTGKQDNHSPLASRLFCTDAESDSTRDQPYVLVSVIAHMGVRIDQGHFVTVTTMQDGRAKVYDDDGTKMCESVDRAFANYKAQPYLLFYERKNGAGRVTTDLSNSSDLDLPLALPLDLALDSPVTGSSSEIEFVDAT